MGRHLAVAGTALALTAAAAYGLAMGALDALGRRLFTPR